MQSEQMLERFRQLTVWTQGDQRAPHKPLLVLYALGQCLRDPNRPLPFAEIDRELTTLLRQFGPPRKRAHPEYPFWRLQNDEVWTVRADSPLVRRASNSDPKKSELLNKGAVGGFTTEVADALAADPTLVQRIAAELVHSHFPETLREEILLATGLAGIVEHPLATVTPAFREAVLNAYGYRCAVTGLDLRLGQNTVGLDAAHIKMSAAGGPHTPANGLALSALHHRLFDYGAFTIQPEGLTIVVSELANGSTLERELLQYHGKPIHPPQRPEQRPDPEFLRWHARELFRGRARHVA